MIALIWLATVAGASTLTWTVISSAGARVSQPVTVATSTALGTSGAQTTDAVRTWTGHGGRLTAGCAEDGSVSLGTAVPEDGYWVKVYDPGPVTLRVDFESTDADDRAEVRITATCVAGAPVFKRI